MLFNSGQFLAFFALVTLAYYALPARFRWALLLAASCYFYMVAVPWYLLILVVVILIDYTAGLLIAPASGGRRRAFLALSICANVAILSAFKYFDFFDDNVARAARLIGWNYSVKTLGLILPVGLSFHTFQSMSYTIEVYRGRYQAERHLGIFALYVMFYPQLVAGPIERPQSLLPQFRRPHYFSKRGAPLGGFADFDSATVVGGLQLMTLGFFKKIVIADRLAVVVNHVYDAPHLYRGLPLMMATIFFAIQIYCDFAGYSDIARGAARVMGFRLSENFHQPYAATSIADFWHRWHISLSTWFRDYVYIPLGGNRASPPRWIANIMITFLLSGLWHGANWTFVLWGAMHGLFIIVGRATSGVREAVSDMAGLTRLPRVRHGLRLVVTFALVCTTWVLFRAKTVSDAWYVATHVFPLLPAGASGGLMVRLGLANLPLAKHEWLIALALIAGTVAAQAFEWRRQLQDGLRVWPVWARWSIYYAAGAAILFLGVFVRSAFIYFQF